MKRNFIDCISNAYAAAKHELAKIIRNSYDFTANNANVLYDRYDILISRYKADEKQNFYYIEVQDMKLEDENYKKWCKDENEDSELESSCVCRFDLSIPNVITDKAYYMAKEITFEMVEVAISDFVSDFLK